MNPAASDPKSSTHRSEVAEGRVSEIASLLKTLDESAENSGHAEKTASRPENQLVQVRLGIASSLFTALRCKHAPTASHSMRVALGCSAWTLTMDLSDQQRDHLEVASLLHDIGKIGVPDHILHKPGNLSSDEESLMNHHPVMGEEILKCCCAPPEIMQIVRYAPAWYDGTRSGFDCRGKDLPLGARVVAIVDAFDAMTTDHVYRKAMSRERALAELYEFAGRQFDPDLVRHFGHLHDESLLDLHSKVSQRWLEAIAPDVANQQWSVNLSTAHPSQALSHTLFQQKLLDNMHDGVVFVDSQQRIFLWNHGAERLTGISGGAAYQRTWRPSLVALRDEKGSRVTDGDCPVAASLQTGVQSMRRMSIAGKDGRDNPIDLHAIPVIGRDGTTYGATLLMHDAASETTLEERCQQLHSQVTKDPMTQVANRAEFDRVHELFLSAHAEARLPCSLIIADIDRFKSVNDNYGHQAGDEVITSFAKLLKSMCRQGDLVARYGGEEFVMLCADCNNAAGAARAEELRRALSETPQPMLGNRCITASFGVTENQPGDTPDTMLRRADRALLQAKAAGRNRVVQLGTGIDTDDGSGKRSWWPFGGARPTALVEVTLGTSVPLEVVIEKLRGFVADQNAQLKVGEDECVELQIDGAKLGFARRRSDRAVPFFVELRFARQDENEDESGGRLQSLIEVKIRPRRDRDRRRDEAAERARLLLSSLKSYLMAHEELSPDDNAFEKARRVFHLTGD